MTLPITEFKNDHYFLHPFYPCTVMFDGVDYPSAEHAYQAAHTSDPALRSTIRELLDGRTAASFGRRMKVSKEFRLERISIMETIVESKFYDNIHLAKMLLETGTRQLIYSNSLEKHGSEFWGLLRGKGQNHLGQILMRTRKKIKEATDRAAEVRMSKVKFSNPNNLRIDLNEKGQKAMQGDV
jgi:ribA/ribD-fused uncharacterized protein